MSEDGRTLWVGNLSESVTEALLFELFLQTGPIEKLILPSEGEGDNKRHKGQGYIIFKHAESVQYAIQVMDGTSLFSNPLMLKARSLPITYKSSPSVAANRANFDNSALRTGFNKATTWHGQNDFVPRGRGNYRGRGGGGAFYYNQNTNFNQNANFNHYYNNQR